MSLNQLISDKNKPWLNVRFNNVTVDGTLNANIPGNSFGNHLTVAKSGGDFTDLKEAVDFAATLNPSFENPVNVQIYAGLYNVNESINVTSHIHINVLSNTTSDVCSLRGQKTGYSMFNLNDSTSINGVGIYNCDIGITFDSGTSKCNNIKMSDVVEGFISRSRAYINNCEVLAESSTTSKAYKTLENGVIFGSYLIARDPSLGGVNLNFGYSCEGVGGEMYLSNCDANKCIIGFNCISGNLMDLTSCKCIESQFSGINNSGTMNVTGSEITGETTNIQNLGDMVILSTILRRDLINNSGNILGSYFSTTLGDVSLQIEGELSVGSPEFPSESAFGGGDSYVNGMSTYLTSGSNPMTNFVDVTNILRVGSGTSTPIYNSPDLEDCLLIGSLYPFNGIKINVSLGREDPGSQLEYFDGLNWVTTKVMSTDSEAPYAGKGQDIFRVGSYQYRFGYKTSDQGLGTFNGLNKYWFRFVQTSVETPLGSLSQIKLHPPGRFEINKDGFTEIYNEDVTSRQFLSLNSAQAVGNSPSNNPLYLDISGTFVGYRENSFVNNATDRLSISFTPPENIDTSKPLKFTFRFVQNVASTGNLFFETRVAFVRDVDDDVSPLSNVYGAANSPGIPFNAPGLVYGQTNEIFVNDLNFKLKNFTIDVDVSNLICKRSSGSGNGDLIFLNFARLANAIGDTYNGDIYIAGLNYNYTRWY